MLRGRGRSRYRNVSRKPLWPVISHFGSIQDLGRFEMDMGWGQWEMCLGHAYGGWLRSVTRGRVNAVGGAARSRQWPCAIGSSTCMQHPG